MTESCTIEGMTKDPVSVEELLKVGKEMHRQILAQLTDNEKQFLISIKEGNPEWDAPGIQGIENLPGLRWKLSNIKKMSKEKHAGEVKKLKQALKGYSIRAI